MAALPRTRAPASAGLHRAPSAPRPRECPSGTDAALGRNPGGPRLHRPERRPGRRPQRTASAAASRAGVELDAEALPIDPAARAWFAAAGPRSSPCRSRTAARTTSSPVTSPPRFRGRLRHVRQQIRGLPITPVGVVTKEPTVRLRAATGRASRCARGYEHLPDRDVIRRRPRRAAGEPTGRAAAYSRADQRAARRRTPSRNTRKLVERFLSTSMCGVIVAAHSHFALPGLGQPAFRNCADPPACTASASTSHVPQMLSCT